MAQPPLFGSSEDKPLPIQEGENANRSVFVVFNFVSGPVKGAVYQFKIGKGGQIMGGVIKDANEPPLLSPAHTFFEDKGNNSLPLTLMGASYFGASSKLYLMLHADLRFPPTNIHIPIPKSHSVDGLIFDAKTMSLGRFSPPMEHKVSGFLASAYGKLYYIAPATPYPQDLTVPFERYDPTTDCWESLPPCPEDMNISGYAVCQDCILFSFMLDNYSSKLMVFHINTKQWHEVEAPSDDDDDEDTSECLYPFPFQGQAVVVGDTIYAISYCNLQVIAFSLRIKSNEINCPSYFIDSLNVLPGLDHVSPPSRFHVSISSFLVPLGNLEFCLVESGFNYKSSRRQHLCITTFRVDLGEGNLKRIQTLHSKVLDAELLHKRNAFFVSSFTPDYDDTESQEGKSSIMASDAVEEQSPSVDEEIEPSGKVFNMAQPPLSGLSEDKLLIQEGENANKSVFVVFNFVSGPVKGAMYQFKIGRGGRVLGGVIKDAKEPPLLSPDHTFFEDKGNNSLPVTLMGASYFGASSKLYLMLHADFSYPPSNIHIPIPKSHSVDGLIFDAKTMSLGRFSPPMEHKLSGFLASAYGKLYYIATASPYPEDLTVPFERYDPTTDSWESLPPCPEDMNISGYAVCQSCILFSFMLDNYSSKLMVFHINTKQWHEVEAPSDDDDDTFEYLYPFPFHGQAVVVADTIYAISQCYLQVIAFSLRIKSNEIDCPSYFIDILNKLPVLDHVFPPSRFHGSISRFLVPLGNLEFCLVESGFNYKSSCRQHLCITTFRVDLGEGNLKRIQTLHSKVLDAELLHDSSAIFVSSFTPDYDDTESQEGKSPIMASDAVEVPSADEDIEPSGKATAYKKPKSEAISLELE